MNIGFDATVVHGRKSGVGYYCQELLRALLALGEDDRYFVFSHLPLSGDLVEPSGTVEFSDRGFCRVRALYLHALLPGILRQANIELAHFTNFLAPVPETGPYVLTIHDMSIERLQKLQPLGKRVYTKRFVPRMARRARLILTNSEFSKWDIVRFLGIEERRIRVTPLAASAIFRPVGEAERKPVLASHGLDRPYFLYLGNIEPRKNLERLLEAFKATPQNDRQLVIAGDAWFLAKRVRQKAADLGLGDRVRFLGYVPRRDLPGIIGGATAFVYPSLLEGFGLPVLEAMACGRPVITSRTTALAEVAGDSALLVDPTSASEIADALVAVAEDAALAARLSEMSVRRAAHFSWRRTAEKTRLAYLEAIGDTGAAGAVAPANGDLGSRELLGAVRRTIAYANQFDYPLSVAELQERLIGVCATVDEVDAAVRGSDIALRDGWVAVDHGQVERRRAREAWSDQVMAEFERDLRALRALPFVKMLAFSGATAHRNMRDRDVDLFAVVEDGKVWSVLLAATLWAKLRGVRSNICLNYVVGDRTLPIFQTDLFTAQQVASLKPFFGKSVYDRFVAVNPFVRRHFPNFDPAVHRDAYEEIPPWRLRRVLDLLLRCGPAQLVESASRRVLLPYLRGKSSRTDGAHDGDVLLEHSRIKLHLNSHRQAVLTEMEERRDDGLPGDTVGRSLAPAPDESQRKDVEVQPQ